MARWFISLLAALTLAGCGGGGSSSSAPIVSPTPIPIPTPAPTPAVANTAPLTIDAGPAALQAGSNGFSAFNSPFVTVTLCPPGSTSNCQTIDHIILDTGSVGLRIITPVLNASVLAALPAETDGANNSVGECYQYVNSYAFGSVRTADFSIAGEKVASMPFQAIGDTGKFAAVPSSCSAGGGSDIATVQDFGANGIIGVGTTTTDCGAFCTVAGGSSAAIYYDCPSAGCGAIIGRAANEAAPFQQLPNPVAAFPADNNGVILTLPSVPQAGVAAVAGTVTFGIGTQSDNALAAPNVLPVTTSSSRLGPGVLTATYKGRNLTQSFLDSGSNNYFFIDTSLPPCTDPDLIAFYCPGAPLLLSPVLTATNGATASGAFTLFSPLDVLPSATAAPGLGINPTLVTPPLPFANSFDFGLPFFFGRTVYTSIEGRPAGGVQGPYLAF
ncbi:MAG: Heavy-chain fibroin [Alphaproteobacteria bacterium]|nr:Heavy-chain fibroin [Alphaproteobacteria bacterium]